MVWFFFSEIEEIQLLEKQSQSVGHPPGYFAEATTIQPVMSSDLGMEQPCTWFHI